MNFDQLNPPRCVVCVAVLVDDACPNGHPRIRTATFDLVSFANGLLASQRPTVTPCDCDGEGCYTCHPVKCGGCSQPATRRDAFDVADVCDDCGEASDDRKRDRERRQRRMAEREEI